MVPITLSNGIQVPIQKPNLYSISMKTKIWNVLNVGLPFFLLGMSHATAALLEDVLNAERPIMVRGTLPAGVSVNLSAIAERPDLEHPSDRRLCRLATTLTIYDPVFRSAGYGRGTYSPTP